MILLQVVMVSQEKSAVKKTRSGAKHTESHDSAGYVPMMMARDVMGEA